MLTEDEKESLQPLLAKLDSRADEVLKRRIGWSAPPETLREISEALDISREQARRSVAEAKHAVGAEGRALLEKLLPG